MKVLVLGASGATGRLVVSELVGRKLQVKALIRSTAAFPQELRESAAVEVVAGSVGDFSASRIGELMSDCDAVVFCLGHTVSFKGLFGRPRRLVRDAIRKTVRPDSLFDEAEPGERLVVERKLRSPMFDPGKTSRITVARFMSDLLSDETLWNEWRFKTPVVYNRD